MTLSVGLLRISALIFAAIGLAYLVVPSAMLSVVGIGAAPTTDFLMRTEGVALLAGAGLLWAAQGGSSAQRRLALVALAFYFIVGSVVDLAAFAQGVVGPASVPSGVIRIGVGLVCAFAAWRERR